jgi:hypothetical protein
VLHDAINVDNLRGVPRESSQLKHADREQHYYSQTKVSRSFVSFRLLSVLSCVCGHSSRFIFGREVINFGEATNRPGDLTNR